MTRDLMAEFRIARLEQDWGLCRDTGNWSKLRSLYAPEADMKTTWFSGPASTFVDACERGFGKGPLAQHFMGACTVEVVGDRATAEIRVALLVRDVLDDVPIDITCWCRFHDRLVRVDGDDWKIVSRMPVYEKDQVQAIDPARWPVFDQTLLATYPAGFRHLAYMQARGGATISRDLPAPNSPEQFAYYASSRAWLDNDNDNDNDNRNDTDNQGDKR